MDESEIFVNFCIKGGVRKLPQSSLLVEVGPLNNDCAAFVGRFNNYVCVFLDSLVATTLPLKIGKFGVTIKFKFVNIDIFLRKKLKMLTDPLEESIETFESKVFQKKSLFVVLESSSPRKRLSTERGEGILQRLA